jgi:hypothetical protein
LRLEQLSAEKESSDVYHAIEKRRARFNMEKEDTAFSKSIVEIKKKTDS